MLKIDPCNNWVIYLFIGAFAFMANPNVEQSSYYPLFQLDSVKT